MKGEKEEKQICEIILKSDLNYWESLGMLEHIKMELKRIIDKNIDEGNEWIIKMELSKKKMKEIYKEIDKAYHYLGELKLAWENLYHDSRMKEEKKKHKSKV